MPLRLYSHSSPTIFETSFSKTDNCVGKFFTDPNERRLGRTNYELVATFDACFLGNPDLGLPEQVPFVYQVRDPNFYPFTYSLRSNGHIKVESRFRTVPLPKGELKSARTIFGTQQKYDPTDAVDALDWAGVFGLDRLSDAERERAIAIVTEAWGSDWSSRCIVPIEHYESKWSIVRGEWIRPFWQNASFYCPVSNSNCDELTDYKSTVPIATLETDNNIDLFGGYGSLLILTFCKVCKTFGVENQAN